MGEVSFDTTEAEDELLDADDFNFKHDLSGIQNCIDRKTGQLTRNFRPRFAA